MTDSNFNCHYPVTLAIISVLCSNPSVSSRQASYPSPLSKAHWIAHSAAVPLKIKAFALILLRRIDFRRQPCEAKASQGDLRKSIGRATAPFAQGSLSFVELWLIVLSVSVNCGSLADLFISCKLNKPEDIREWSVKSGE